MDEFDNFVKKRCHVLSAGEQLRTGFSTKCEMKNSLVKAYKNKSIQKDFGGIGMSRTPLSVLAVDLLQPELRFPTSEAISVPTNFIHRPQVLTAPVIPSNAQISQIQGDVDNLIDMEQQLTTVNSEYDYVKNFREEAQGPTSPPSEAEQNLYDKIQDLRNQIQDQRARNRVEQNVLAQREMDALEDIERARRLGERTVEREVRRGLRAKENAVLNLPPKELVSYIEANWDGLISGIMRNLPPNERKSKSALIRMGGKAEFLLNKLQIPVENIYEETIGFNEQFSRETTPAPDVGGPSDPDPEAGWLSRVSTEEEPPPEEREREQTPSETLQQLADVGLL
jgi:hypothetical protein